MTTANKITLTRIAMIPFFIYFAAQPMLIIDETRYLAAFPTSTVIALVLFCVACRLLCRKVKVRIACAFGASVVNYPLTAQRYAFFKQSLVISEVSVLYA